jgi:cyclomaltodextrin glucanotransferase
LPGMQRCEESTPAFRLISALAALRKISPAIQRRTYIPLYAKGDVLIYERIDKERIDGDRTDGDDLVLVAVNRASATDVELQSRMGFSPGAYRGLITDTSSGNPGNYLRVGPTGSTVHLGPLSSIVVRR